MISCPPKLGGCKCVKNIFVSLSQENLSFCSILSSHGVGSRLNLLSFDFRLKTCCHFVNVFHLYLPTYLGTCFCRYIYAHIPKGGGGLNSIGGKALIVKLSSFRSVKAVL